MYFYKNFNYLRSQNLLSLQSMAKQCNVCASNLSGFSRGIYKEENLPLLTIMKIAKHYQISLNDLINKDLSKKRIDEIRNVDEDILQTYIRSNMIYFIELDKLSLYGISKATCISRFTLIHIKNKICDEKNITIRTVMKLSEFFNIPLDDFVFKDFSNENEIKLTR